MRQRYVVVLNSILFILLSCQIIDNFLATLTNYLNILSSNNSAIFAHHTVLTFRLAGKLNMAHRTT
jgi:hypothetical protein